MICTRFGTEVERFISKDIDAEGNTWIMCRLKKMPGDREVHLADFRADNGANEIDEAIKDLPLRKGHD